MNDVPTHAQMVRSLAKSGEALQEENSPLKCHLNHMVIGLCGEVGELADAIKKFTIYNKPLDFDNVIEELGDLEFYMEGLRQALGISQTQTKVANIEKLGKRYREFVYTDERAVIREDKQ